ncbi:Rpb4 family DNA-directed RNA polymerase subunit, partial [Bacillus safensis]|nr:Rpb4 family DNA-directed RNA polymerase subunit [Bacillus safensis]
CNQTQENINEFLKSCEKYKLAKAEKLNIINIRPSTQVEIDPIIEECQNRLKEEQVEELVELIANLFPPPPTPEGADEA